MTLPVFLIVVVISEELSPISTLPKSISVSLTFKAIRESTVIVVVFIAVSVPAVALK